MNKEFSNNHRQNYAQYNKSNIFDTGGSYDTFQWKDTNKKSQNTFIPKYSNESAQERKMKEYGNNFSHKEQAVKINSNVVFKENSSKNKSENVKIEQPPQRVERVNQQNQILNAKEKRLLDLNPQLKLEDVKNMNRATSVYQQKSFTTSTQNKNFTATDRRTNDQNSNIFNDPDKTEENVMKRNQSVILKKNKQEEELNKQNEKLVEKKLNYSKTKSNLGSNFNSEMVFNKSKSNNENVSAREMKQQQMKSAFDSDNKVIPPTPEKEERKENVKEILKSENFQKDKLNKMMNLASSQDSAFSQQNYSLREKQDRPVEKYEIVSKDGFDKLEPKEINKIFSRKGIHVYDYEEKGRYHDGFQTGNINFKIRMSEDPNFNNKIEEIGQVIGKMGMKFNHVEVNTNKPTSDLVPTGMKWNECRAVDGRIDKCIESDKIKKNLLTEKYGNYLIQSDSSYKNTFSMKKMNSASTSNLKRSVIKK